MLHRRMAAIRQTIVRRWRPSGERRGFDRAVNRRRVRRRDHGKFFRR
jgi:hypothetical protein